MKQHRTDDDFISEITRRLDEDAANLDTDISNRLSANRRCVIDNISDTPDGFLAGFSWQHTTAFMAASLLVLVTSVFLLSIDERPSSETDNNILVNADYNIDDDAVIAEYELLNDLEFISWLIEEENTDENNAS